MEKITPILTIDEVLFKHGLSKLTITTLNYYLCQAFKEFAALHVEAALQAASEKASTSNVNKEDILTAYPKENIK